jgi:hypothetical protein
MTMINVKFSDGTKREFATHKEINAAVIAYGAPRFWFAYDGTREDGVWRGSMTAIDEKNPGEVLATVGGDS